MPTDPNQRLKVHSQTIRRQPLCLIPSEDHYLEQLTLEDIARHADISVRHLNRILRTYYQTTPFSYLLHLRLEHDGMLLKRTNLLITDISYSSGFNDSNYFTRHFRKTYGMTPRSYRRANQPIATQNK